MRLKIVPFVLIVLVIGIAAYWWRVHPEPPLPSPAIESPLFVDFAALVPDSALAVLAINSPERFLAKAPPAKYPNVAAAMRRWWPDFDFTDANAWRDKGLDPGKPAGVALLKLRSARFTTKPVALFFAGVKDEDKFAASIKEKLTAAGLFLEEKTIAAVPCVLVKYSGAASAIYCFRGGFWTFYIGSPADAESHFEEQVLSLKSRLVESETFRACRASLTGTPDFYCFVNLKRSLDTVKEHNYSAGDLGEQIISPASRGMIVSFTAEGSAGRFSAYLDSAEPSAISKSDSCREILDAFPPQPLLCCTCNLKIAENWTKIREYLDMFWPAIMQAMRGQLPWENPPASLTEALRRAETAVAEELGVTIDLEESVIRNFQGNAAFALYRFSTLEAVDFDAALAFKIKDSVRTADVLAKLASAMNQKNLAVEETAIGENHIFTVDAKEWQTLRVRPTIGVFRGHLLLTSQKDTAVRILESRENLWSGIPDPEIARGMVDGDTVVAYLDLAAMSGKSNPGEELSRNFRKFTWHTWRASGGIHTTAVLTAEEDLLDAIFFGIERIFVGQEPGPVEPEFK